MYSFSQFLYEIKSEHGKYLHGTLRDNVPSIKNNWIEPKVGHNTSKAYGDEVTPAVHLAGENDVKRAYTAMTVHIGHKLNKHCSEVDGNDIEKHGAMVVHTPKREWDKPHLYDPDKGWEYERDDRPESAEPGDYYSHEAIRPTGIMFGTKLREFLKKKGLTD